MKRDFEFDGSGFGYLWLCIWTTVLTVITCGLFFPWAYSAQQRWICSNTYVNGRQLRFEGTGFGFFFQWLLIMVLTTITFGIYIPWGFCVRVLFYCKSMAYSSSLIFARSHSSV